MCWAVAVSLSLPSGAAWAEPSNRFGLENPAAVKRAEAATEAAQADDYETAIRELKAAYAIESKPILLYAWAQAERLGGHCNRAIKLYEDFLGTDPPTELANEAQVNLLDCQAEEGIDRAPREPIESTETEPDEDETNDEADDEPSALRREKVAPILLGLGAATAIGGGVAMGIAQANANDAANANNETGYAARIDEANTIYLAGGVIVGVGSALIVGGIVRYIVVARRNKQPTTTASAMVTRDGFGLTLQGRF